MTPRFSPFLARLSRKPLAIAAIAWLVLLTLACVAAPLIAPADPTAQDLLAIKLLPSVEHWLGTDRLGRDVLSRVLFGGTGALLGTAQAVITATVIGVILGTIGGFLRGATDTAVSGFIDVVLAIPTIVILLSVLALFDQDMGWAMFALGLLGSAGIARVVRAATIAMRDDLYIDAARVNGLPTTLILWSHVLPRVAAPIVVQVSLFSASALIAQTGIAFLGLGVPPTQPSWGGLIADASVSIGDFPWLLVPSGGVVALTILAFGLAGDGVRDALTEIWSASPGRVRASATKAESTSAHSAVTDVAGPLDPDVAMSVRNLHVSDGSGRSVLRGVSFDLHPGEVLGLVGESGSGKTTTALASIGLLPHGLAVSTGELWVHGRSFTLGNRRSMRQLWGRTIGLVSQEPMIALDPCTTVADALIEVIRRRDRGSRRAARARMITLLEQVQIPNPAAVAKKYPHQLSGGMAQRVAIARALGGRPDILVADEPTTALDVTVQADILDLIRTVARDNRMSVLFVTHDWGVVADICDRVMVLYHGRVQETATAKQIFSSPETAYTRALLAANPHGATPGTRLPTVTDLIGASA
jgi:peptide/nickel transport system permease protein